MKLYEIADNYLKILDMDLDEETLADTLEAIEGDLEDKVENIATLIKSLTYDAKAIKEEEKSLADRRKQKEITAERVKNYLFDTLKRIGKDKLETPRHKLAIRKNPVSVNLKEDFYHEAYTEEVVSYKTDKKAIKEALQAGEVIEGASLVQGERLDIK